LRARLEAKRVAVDKMTEQRTMMQKRLKEIYMRNQRKNPSQRHREENYFDSPSSNIGFNTKSTTSSAISNFFGESSNISSPANNRFQIDSFGSSPSVSSFKIFNDETRGGKRERSQNDRTPFYA
jgi:hypothetical protein